MYPRIPIPNGPIIALEMPNIHRVEPHDRHIQPDVRLRQRAADEVRAAVGEEGLEAVEGGEKGADGRLVGCLGGGEA